MFKERRNVKIIHQAVSSTQNPYLLTEQEEANVLKRQEANRQRLRVPRRPPWTKLMTPVQLDKQEKVAFLDWRRGLAEYVVTCPQFRAGILPIQTPRGWGLPLDAIWTQYWSLETVVASSWTISSDCSNSGCAKSPQIPLSRPRGLHSGYRRTRGRTRDREGEAKEFIAHQQGRLTDSSATVCLLELISFPRLINL